MEENFTVCSSDQILVTGANGFIGSRVVECLLRLGFTNLRCFVRPSSDLRTLEKVIASNNNSPIHILKGNLLSREDCEKSSEGVRLIYHLAAGRGEKSFPDAYMNSVLTTRNLLDSVLNNCELKRFVNVSSFAVYSNRDKQRHRLLDESNQIESEPHLTGEAYRYAKVKQEEMAAEYFQQHHIPIVTVRPGVVYGPGNKGLTGRVGIGTFGIFLHLGGSNRIPLTFVNNCAEAIVLAGLKKGIEGEAINIVDDYPPTSREFLKMYKRNVKSFRTVYLPHVISYLLCYLWEKYSDWSKGQLPPAFNRKKWASYWKGNIYSNDKLKRLLGWEPRIGVNEALRQYFDYQKKVTGAD
jgi:nucleoside-diphosphate-sugar epimerase